MEFKAESKTNAIKEKKPYKFLQNSQPKKKKNQQSVWPKGNRLFFSLLEKKIQSKVHFYQANYGFLAEIKMLCGEPLQ